MNMILEKGNCDECGCRLIDYDENYSNGMTKLCGKCFEKYEKTHPVIIEHCPGCVENGGDYDFYLWEGLEKFLKDHPLKDGWEYRRDSGNKIEYIMENATFKDQWWVMWIVRNPEIIKEIRKKLPPMKYNRR